MASVALLSEVSLFRVQTRSMRKGKNFATDIFCCFKDIVLLEWRVPFRN